MAKESKACWRYGLEGGGDEKTRVVAQRWCRSVKMGRLKARQRRGGGVNDIVWISEV